MIEIVCLYCGKKKFVQRCGQKFCSRECYRAAKRNRPELVKEGRTLKRMIGLEKSFYSKKRKEGKDDIS